MLHTLCTALPDVRFSSHFISVQLTISNKMQLKCRDSNLHNYQTAPDRVIMTSLSSARTWLTHGPFLLCDDNVTHEWGCRNFSSDSRKILSLSGLALDLRADTDNPPPSANKETWTLDSHWCKGDRPGLTLADGLTKLVVSIIFILCAMASFPGNTPINAPCTPHTPCVNSRKCEMGWWDEIYPAYLWSQSKKSVPKWHTCLDPVGDNRVYWVHNCTILHLVLIYGYGVMQPPRTNTAQNIAEIKLR